MSFLKINKLLIVSPARNYELAFKSGVNIISGPTYTGKSTSLTLIDYALGASNYTHIPELAHCSDVFLELSIDSDVFTFSRSLKNASEMPLFYDCSIEDIFENNILGTRINAKEVKGQDSISSIIMHRLGLAESVVKLARKKDSSEAQTLSFRDIFKLLYVSQTRITSSKFFFEDDIVLYNKTIAAIETIWNLYDSKKAVVGSQIQTLEKLIAETNKSLEATRKFLNELEIPILSEIDQRLGVAKDELSTLRGERVSTAKEVGVSPKSRSLNDKIKDVSLLIENDTYALNEIRRSLMNLSKLKVQYDREFQQLQFLDEATSAISGIPVTVCPSCFQKIITPTDSKVCRLCSNELRPELDENLLKHRMAATKLRVKDLNTYIKQLEDQKNVKQRSLAIAELNKTRFEKEFRELNENYMLVATQEIVALEKLISLKEEEIRKLNDFKSLRLKAGGEGSKLTQFIDELEKLKINYSELRSDEVTRVDVLTDLTNRFRKILKFFELPQNISVELDDDFTPILRGSHYSNLSSLGAIGLSLSAYLLASLKRGIDLQTSHPCLLIIDSPLNHLGKDKAGSVFPDQVSIDRFYTVLNELDTKWQEKFQFIMVDNRAPEKFRHLVNIEFSRIQGEGRYGLIDDQFTDTSDIEV